MRERLGDLLRITGHYLEFFSAQCKKPVKAFTPRAAEAMQRYSWPGNLRELRNLVERAVILATGELIDLADLPEKMRDAVAASPDGHSSGSVEDFPWRNWKANTSANSWPRPTPWKKLRNTGNRSGNALPQAQENFSPIGIGPLTRRLSRCSWIYTRFIPLENLGGPFAFPHVAGLDANQNASAPDAFFVGLRYRGRHAEQGRQSVRQIISSPA